MGLNRHAAMRQRRRCRSELPLSARCGKLRVDYNKCVNTELPYNAVSKALRFIAGAALFTTNR